MNEKKMIEEMAKVMCEKKIKCKDCVFEDFYCIYKQGATELYNAGYHRVADDDVVIKKSELARLKNLEINYEQVYEEYRKLEQERKSCRLIADDEIVVKKRKEPFVFYDNREEIEKRMQEYEEEIEQVKKETAREIFQELYDEAMRNTNEVVELTAFEIKQLAKEKGIELE